MFNIGAEKLLVLLVVALIVLGPERLPGAIREVAKVLGQIRSFASGMERELRDTVGEPFTELQNTVDMLRGRAPLEPINNPLAPIAPPPPPAPVEPLGPLAPLAALGPLAPLAAYAPPPVPATPEHVDIVDATATPADRTVAAEPGSDPSLPDGPGHLPGVPSSDPTPRGTEFSPPH